MMQLSNMLWLSGIFFAILGFQRGWNRELLALAGIVLGLFALFQFDPLLRGSVLVAAPPDQVFFVQAALFGAITFFAYQTRLPELEDREGRRSDNSTNRADNLQESILGAIVGFLNGYLIWGAIWYFLDINEYPLSPYIVAPAPGSASDQQLGLIPLLLLGGGASGDLLAIAVIVLFLIVLVAL